MLRTLPQPQEPLSGWRSGSSEKGSQAQAGAARTLQPPHAGVPCFCLGVAFPAEAVWAPGLTLVIKPRRAGQAPPQRAQLCSAGARRPGRKPSRRRGEAVRGGGPRRPAGPPSAGTVARPVRPHALYLPAQHWVRRPGPGWPAAPLGPVPKATHLATATSWLTLGEARGAGRTVALGPPERTLHGSCHFTSSHRGAGGQHAGGEVRVPASAGVWAGVLARAAETAGHMWGPRPLPRAGKPQGMLPRTAPKPLPKSSPSPMVWTEMQAHCLAVEAAAEQGGLRGWL